MRVLVVGNGGREHAIATQISKSKLLTNLYITPGNPGSEQVAKRVLLDIKNILQVVEWAQNNTIDLVVIGPEQPLVDGLSDALRAVGIAVVGPTQAAARLEGSKAFAKDFMQKYQIPTAQYATFTDYRAANQYLLQQTPPYVIKADGLAAGKGVLVTSDLAEAQANLQALLLDQKLGQAGNAVVIESFLDGIEVSCFALCDGNNYVLLPEAKDYKRIGEDDTGPNTGGMGAISPVPFVDSNFLQQVEQNILQPTLRGMQAEGAPFQGFLFMGLMNVAGAPFVIEYNVRLGDPETQAILLRIESDFLALLHQAARAELKTNKIAISTQTAAVVVCAAPGYPEAPIIGAPLILPNELPNNVKIFHAGVKLNSTESDTNTALVTAGGRICSVAAMGKNLNDALDLAYQTVDKIEYQGKYYRRDIGQDLLTYIGGKGKL